MRTRNAAIMVTRRCNMSCGHCSVESHPKIKAQPTEEELRVLVDGLIDSGVTVLQFTGGEPLIRGPLVLELMRRAHSRGVCSSIISNGFWGKKPEVAEKTFDELREAGMVRLALSYDRFHAEFQGHGPILNILRVAQKRDWPIHINITRALDDTDLDEIVAPFHGQSHALLRFYDVQPVGLAKNLDEKLRAQIDGYCSSCEQITFTDNGRVTACNGPAYFERPESGLIVGEYSSGKTSLADLLERHHCDPILQLIRTQGPARLMEILKSLPGFESFPFREHYSGMCQVCLDINRDVGAVAALRQHLSTPEMTAELVARRRVQDEAKRVAHNRVGTNEGSGPAAFLRVLMGTPNDDTEKLLGRADLDWHRQMELLGRSGLLHLFHGQRDNPLIARWAPHFFWKAVEEAAALAEATLRSRREELAMACDVGRQAGFQVRAAAASAVLEQGGSRVPNALTLATDGDPTTLRRLVEQRVGPAYPVLVHRELSAPAPAVELLDAWQHDRYANTFGVAWDLSGVRPETRALANRRAHRAALRALFAAVGLGPETEGQRSWFDLLLEKVIGYQMFRDPRHRPNVYLGSAVCLLGAESVFAAPLTLLRSLRIFCTDLLILRRGQGWRVLAATWKADTVEAWQAVRALRSRGRRTV